MSTTHAAETETPSRHLGPILRLEGVRKSFGDNLVLDGIDLDVQTGEVVEFKNEEIERIQQRIASELGFELVGHRLELYGRRTRSKA